MRLLEESLFLTCPNPKCRRQFKESIVLTINSVEPPKQYDACPFCFASLETESPIEQEKNSHEEEIKKEVTPEPVFDNEILELEESKELSDELGNNSQDNMKDSGSSFFSKVKSLIPGSSDPKKEKKQKVEESETDLEILVDEDQPKDKLEIKAPAKIESQKNVGSTSKQNVNSVCPQAFGYLANRPKDETIPQVCFMCPKMVDCMLSPRES